MRFTKFGICKATVVMCLSGTLVLLSSVGAGAASKGDREALADAQEYLSSQAFSLRGLISQVKYDGFSTAVATYGAVHSGANWNKEAYLDAKEYLKSQAFSLGGLISQLEYDGFTSAQATYGAHKAY